MEIDPILEIEKKIRELHDEASKYTKPVLQRYPLIFAFLLTFSLAAILHGFELATDEMSLFRDNPWLLIIIGSVTLLLTGTLYKILENDNK
ncbi:MAG: hypothetical protein ABL917_02450 [Parcubacteria group bacterium]